MPEKLYRRSVDQLTPKELATLQAINRPEDIKECRIMDTWEDDHVLCVGVSINHVQVGFWWSDYEIVGHLTYCLKVREAAQEVVKYLKHELEAREHE